MKFTETNLKGAFVIEPEPNTDERGFFARIWCHNELKEHGLNPNLAQSSIALSKKKWTLRGMHYQLSPCEEAKLVLCTKGAIYDAIIDLRPNSQTYKKWFGIEITEKNRKMIYVPEGFAHGYQALEDNTEILYFISQFYDSKSSTGVRWNDPAFGLKWPNMNETQIIISEKDKNFPDFKK
jgi:dTDP-4-dehydrorhamnose 3,5-epimerase